MVESTSFNEDVSIQNGRAENTENFSLDILERTSAGKSGLDFICNIVLLIESRRVNVKVGSNVTLQVTDLWDTVCLILK